MVLARFAVYGDSYVKRQREYGGHFGIPVEVRIFGRGGMGVKTYDEQL